MKELLDVVTDIRNFARKTVDHRDIIDYCNDIIVEIHRELDNAVDREQDIDAVVEKVMKDNDNHWGYSKIVGTSFREDIPWPMLRPGLRLELVREPENEHDKNAIKVMFVENQLGYIPKDTASKLAPLMDDRNGLTFYSRITEITGGTEEKSNKGINITIKFNKALED